MLNRNHLATSPLLQSLSPKSPPSFPLLLTHLVGTRINRLKLNAASACTVASAEIRTFFVIAHFPRHASSSVWVTSALVGLKSVYSAVEFPNAVWRKGKIISWLWSWCSLGETGEAGESGYCYLLS